MDRAGLLLAGTAAVLGLGHTLVGVDHTLPFVVLARAERWTLGKTLAVTAACGAAHVLSSVLIGAVGIGLGVAASTLGWLEAARGGLAARLLIGFGLAYMVWGMYRARRGRRHRHGHAHVDGTVHEHEHHHRGEHAHIHDATSGRRASGSVLASLMVVFVLGPCEPLIPLMMAPAAEGSWATVMSVVAVFGAVTVGTMLALVALGHRGLRWHGLDVLEKHMHALAGFAIAASGAAMVLLGL